MTKSQNIQTLPHPATHTSNDGKNPKVASRKAGSAATKEAPAKGHVKQGSALKSREAAPEAALAPLLFQTVDSQASFFDRPLPTVVSQNPALPAPPAIPEKVWTSLSSLMRHTNQHYNYDRMANTNAYGSALKKQGLTNTPDAAKQLSEAYEPSSHKWLREEGGGNCVGLCGRLMNVLKEGGVEATLIGSTLKSTFAIKGGPRIGHVAVLLSVDVGAHKKHILLEPGFNFSHPIVVPGVDEAPVRVPYDDGQWVMTRKHPFENKPAQAGEVHAYLVPKEDPKKPFKLKKADVATYFLDPLADDAENITRGIAPLDKRPIILARDPDGNVVGKVALDYKKRQITVAMHNDRESFHIDELKNVGPGELPVEKIDIGHLADALNTTPEALADKLRTAASLADTLHPLEHSEASENKKAT